MRYLGKIFTGVLVVAVIVAAAYSLRGIGGRGKRPEIVFDGTSERETNPRPTYAPLEYPENDYEEPTAYETKAVETTTEAESTTPEETTAVSEGFDVTDFGNPSGDHVNADNYKSFLINVLSGSDTVFDFYSGCFTDNYIANSDAFQETNPLRNNLSNNEWIEGEWGDSEFVIQIAGETKYRFGVVVIDNQLDSLEFLGEE